MPRTYSLAYLTQLDLPPARAVAIAARTGYAFVGLRLLPAAPGGVAHPLMDDPAGLADTLAAVADSGVGVFDLELIRLGPAFRAADYGSFFEVGARLGARAILVAGDDPDAGRLTASFAALCEACAPFGLSADLEFMPWTSVPDASTALRVVTAAGQPNGGILVDALHVARSRSSLADVAAIPRERLHYAQICDAPAAVPDTVEGLIRTARSARLLPGEGGIDLAGLFATLPPDLPVSVEVPNDARAPALGPEAWARQALAAARAVLERAAPAGPGAPDA